MSNYQSGHKAEKRAAEYLQEQGFTVRELNWKTKYCEIDILAEKESAMYFVEVKSRKNSNQGDGLDYITPKKLKQMAFAAEMWVTNNNWQGEYQLAAIAISQDSTILIENI